MDPEEGVLETWRGGGEGERGCAKLVALFEALTSPAPHHYCIESFIYRLRGFCVNWRMD
jgi:hypothetical protein